jgi:type VI protein secretion system component VasK
VKTHRRFIRAVVLVIAVWAGLGLVALAQFWPPPRTMRGWILFAVFGPVAVVVLEVAGEVAQAGVSRLAGRTRADRRADCKAKAQYNRGLRIAIGVCLGLLYVAVLTILAAYLRA